jgi:G3E family GTPase
MVTDIVSNIPELFLKPVFCLVDILMVRNPIKLTIPIFKRQIDKADFIIFSKTDLLSNEFEKIELIKIFKANFPKANIFDVTKPDISILDIESMDEKTQLNPYSLFEAGLSADNYLQKSYTFDNETVFDVERLAKILIANTCILRAKGTIRTFAGWKLLNYTLTGCIFESCLDCSKSEFVIIIEKSDINKIEIFDSELKKLFQA